MEETVKQGAVLKEEVPELAVDGEDTVPVDAVVSQIGRAHV